MEKTWSASHRKICSAESIALHTPQRQTEQLRREIAQGKSHFLLRDNIAVGIMSVHESVIENLYVLPDRQGRGCGTTLLQFAINQCSNAPTLWVLSCNIRAQKLYERCGFHPTGRTIPRKNGLYELEMQQFPPQRSNGSHLNSNAPKSSFFPKGLRRVVHIVYKK